MNIGNRLEKAERRLQGTPLETFPEGCICFPSGASIEASEEDLARINSVQCSIHGDRLFGASVTPPVYRAKWLKTCETPITPQSMQIEKAWKATPGGKQ